MISRIAIAIGAGLAAALLFYIPVKGSALAMILAIFAALPIMIAGLAFSPSVAFGAAFAGTAALLLALDEIFAATFALTAAFPAWWLTRLAWLARPAANGESGATQMVSSGIRSASSWPGSRHWPPPCRSPAF